ncbi:AAA family ATPase [Phenylobacterium sp. LjRoot225]|uniref:ATP-dependent nuclease n=1 Tax=Phenylobacterium sp. LjRoot225 TaxID=3342285 RepID=UPI003ECDE72F
MRIVHIEIRNFRGIGCLDWAPAPGLNCLIGPGDAGKTTVLDAIELALNPRPNFVCEDTDFHGLDLMVAATITVTLAGLPDTFCSDARYGLHMRSWDAERDTIVDEPGGGEEALSVRATLEPDSLEARWSIFHERLAPDEDPPTLRWLDARQLATTRLGPYADRHLSWGRASVLHRIGDRANMNAQLAAAGRAARDAFRAGDRTVFGPAAARAERLSQQFSVAVRDGYAAELDIQGVLVTSGGVALHDGPLPLRTLGTGSSRLVVSGLQHNTGGPHIALIDEIEHGLEPHRIARLLRHLRNAPLGDDEAAGEAASIFPPQVFMTSHSPVVIRELGAGDLRAVRRNGGRVSVGDIAGTAETLHEAQRHLRANPEAFLAPRILVGEGKTECGLARGLDDLWSATGSESFACQGVVAVNGGGVPSAPTFARHLRELGYEVLVLLDSDEPPDAVTIADLRSQGCEVVIWPGACSTEQRIFLDLPWSKVRELVDLAVSFEGPDRILHTINAALPEGIAKLTSTAFPASIETEEFRRILGRAAKTKDKAWFKDIARAETIAGVIHPVLGRIAETPLGISLSTVRQWVDG